MLAIRSRYFGIFLFGLDRLGDVLRKCIVRVETPEGFVTRLAIRNMRFAIVEFRRLQQTLQEFLEHRWLRTGRIFFGVELIQIHG